MHALCGAVMRKRITDRMNVKETFSDFMTLYYAFLPFLFVRDLMAKNENLKEIVRDFVREDTIFEVVFSIFDVRLMPLIVLTLSVIELNLNFLDRED